jgi:hypothetical protein
MPPAKQPIQLQLPCELGPELASFIRDAGYRFFGDDSVVRNYGTDPNALRIHVETSSGERNAADFLGVLLTRIDHIPSVSITERGTKARGDAKIAYRQGQVL